MGSILDYYKYAALATASYVRMGGKPLVGDAFAQEANAQQGGRLPTEQARFLFDPENRYGAPVWEVLSYYGGDIPESQDPIAADDKSGFAAIAVRAQWGEGTGHPRPSAVRNRMTTVPRDLQVLKPLSKCAQTTRSIAWD